MKYYIWSFIHRMWWCPDSEGYTPNLSEAGLYSAEEAGEIVTSSVFNESIQILDKLAEREGAPTITSLWKR